MLMLVQMHILIGEGPCVTSVDKKPRYSGTDYSGTIQSLPLNTQL